MRLALIALVFAFSAKSIVFAQTGPGGVGNAAGTGGQPSNTLWLKSNIGISQTGGLVDSWADQSGNTNNAAATGATRPSLNTSDALFNNLPSIDFTTTDTYLIVPDADNLDNTTGLTSFVVFVPTGTSSTKGLLSKRAGSNNAEAYVLYKNNATLNTRINSATFTTGNILTGGAKQIASTVFSGPATTATLFQNGTSRVTSNTAPSSIGNKASNVFIGAFDAANDGRNLDGRITEVILYINTLNEAQRIIVENYLSAKYNITIVNDVYTGNPAAYTVDVVGIGQSSSTSHVEASSQGFVLAPANSTLDTNGEFILAGHNGTANAVSTANLGTSIKQRWARDWYVEKTGTLDATISFDFGDGIPGGQYPQSKNNYVLLRYDGSNYQDVGIANANKSTNGDRIVFTVPNADLTNGRYTLGTLNESESPVNGAPARTWYSYQTGNWSSPGSWTLDGAIVPLFVNPGNETPSASDNAVITSGRTITLNVNNTSVLSMEVAGTLDISNTSGHNYTTISGTGRIKMAGAAGSDNFPLGTTTAFADAATGGTVEITGVGIEINQTHLWKDLVVNFNGSSNIATLMADVTLNGALTLQNGIVKFNDDASTSSKTLTVYGNTIVNSSGQFRVGQGNGRHKFNLYGDLTNNGGSMAFTNRSTTDYTHEATDGAATESAPGIVDVAFLNATANQQLLCNGSSKFYRIEIKKGVDDTYKLTLSASAPGNFSLLGPMNYVIDAAQASTNNNAIGLIYGTLEVRANITIPVFGNNNNYAIYAGAQLWVNGGVVNKDQGNSLVPYGKVRVSAGTLTVMVSSGITTRDNGSIIVEGGILNTRQIRTSVLSASNIGGYIQSGGAVTVDGASGVNGDYALFSLTYTGNVFNMSGGTLTVRGAFNSGSRGAIFINSDPANINVTGGTVYMESSNSNVFKVTSRAPFWNVVMRNANTTTRVIDLVGTSSGDTSPTDISVALAPQPLVVLNDLSIQNYITFQANGTDVTIGGNLDIAATNATYTPGANTTKFNGVGVSSITFNNTTPVPQWNNLTVAKQTASNEVSLVSANTTTGLQINGELRVEQGILNYNSFTVSAKGDVYIKSVVGKSASTGKLQMDGTSAQTLTSDAGSIYNLTLNNSNGITLANSAFTVYKQLVLTSGIFNINIFKLTLSGASATISGYDATKYIQTAGTASDGGLEFYYNAAGAKTFPVGTNANGVARYTPALIQIITFTDDGFIAVSPTDGVLQTTNASGGSDILSYYWRIRHSNFSSLPTVSYNFNYAESDVGGTEANYVPGLVLDTTPFTRSTDGGTDDVNTTTNVLYFNGTSTGATFPGAGFTLAAANYTAGAPARFTGAPLVYYSRGTAATGYPGNPWHSASSWSTVSHVGAAASDYPKAGDIAIIGSGNSGANNFHSIDVNSGIAAAAQVVFAAVPAGTYSPRVTVQRTQGVQFGRISGSGTFMVRLSDTQVPSISGDFGDFANEVSSVYDYVSETGAVITLPTVPVVFPNLRFEGGTSTFARKMTNSVEFTVKRNLIVNQQANFALGANVSVAGNAVLSDGTQGRIEFPTSGSNYTLAIAGDLIMNSVSSGTNSIAVVNTTPNTLTHRLSVGGNITVSNGTISLFNGNGASDNNAILEFNGTASGTVTNPGGGAISLYQIQMNKGTSTALSETLSANFTLNALSNISTKPLILSNGLLILNNSGINFSLTSGGGDFSIPSTSGLEVRQGQVSVSGANTGILLDGLLRVSGGTVTMDDAANGGNNYIEYSASGNAQLQVSAGTLTVGSQVRRSLASVAGILKYTQSGGTVTLARNAAPATTRGVFEVINNGSSFTHTGGNFTLTQGINSTTVPSLLIDTPSSNVIGSTITIGDANTPAGANSQNIGIKATVPLNNLTIAGANTPIAKIYITPLTVNGNLTINSSTTFNAQGLDLSIGTNMIANGTFIPANNLTTFFNTGAASISGSSPSLDFYHLTKSNAGTLSLSRAINVNRDLTIAAGVFSDSGNSVTLLGNASIDGTHTSTTGTGITFAGSTQQQLKRSTSGTGNIGIITIDNPSGVIIPDGQGYNFSINTGLRLKQGVLDIGGSLLSLSSAATITPVNPFGGSNMIQTNSSFTDNGVKKNFSPGVSTNFVFPVGQLYYTPVEFVGGTTGTGTPSITVRPANERHPSIVEDSESPNPEIVDRDNVLQYHWIITANTVNGFSSDMKLYYQASLVSVTSPYAESDYIGARVLTESNPTNTINKFFTAVDVPTRTVNFNFSGVTNAGISGEYFAGINDAIPNNIPTYITKGGGNGTGNVNTAVYTTPVPGGGAPSGAVLVVDAGDNLTFNINNVSLYRTEIRAGGTLTIDGTTGHRLGTVVGQGTLRIVSNTSSAVLPAAFYNDFFDCTNGGTLDYDGAGNYEILGGITSLRNLTLDGGGSRTLANNNLTLCNNFTVNGPVFYNTSNRNITVQNSLILTGGGYNTGTGTLLISNGLTQSGGTFDGQAGGTKTVGGLFSLSGGTFSVGSAGTLNLKGNVNYTGGTFSGGSGTARMIFNGTAAQTITGAFSGGSSIFRMEISNSNGLTLAGNVDVTDQLILTNGLITTGSNTFRLTSTATVSPTSGSASSFVNGRLSKVVANGGSFIFPIGKSTRWRPASIAATSAGPLTWNAEYFIGNPTTESGVTNLTPNNGTILRVSSLEYWKISDGSSGNSARIGLSWGTESEVSANSTERESLQVMVWNTPTASRWGNFGGSGFSSGHTQSQGSFSAALSNPFSERIVTLGSTATANPLPIELAWFKGEIVGDQAYLYWKTESELNNDYFEVQRSREGGEFAVIGKVEGNGTTKNAIEYMYEDASLQFGKNYYRLKQVDFDGKSSFSNTIVLEYTGISQLGLKVFPNPTKYTNINLKVSSSHSDVTMVRLFDLTGKIVYKEELNAEQIGSEIQIKTNTLKSGMYVLEVMQGKGRATQRLIIQE